ncbi:MAG: nitrilase-related carbon-nitrogen hydrolase, partial [Streptosporangiaceae bacterium]
MHVALGQLPVSSVPSANLARVEAAVASAAGQGAQLAVFPEGMQARFSADLRQAAQPLDGPFCAGRAQAARRAGVAIVAGVFEPAG